jgi:hypothetical protein
LMQRGIMPNDANFHVRRQGKTYPREPLLAAPMDQ